jgi:hypothetical protein
VEKWQERRSRRRCRCGSLYVPGRSCVLVLGLCCGQTPARYAREVEAARLLNEKLQQDKFVEFELACNNGEPSGCNGVGEWYAVSGKGTALPRVCRQSPWGLHPPKPRGSATKRDAHMHARITLMHCIAHYCFAHCPLKPRAPLHQPWCRASTCLRQRLPSTLSPPTRQVLHSEYDKAVKYFKPNCEVRRYGASCFHMGVLNAAERVEDATPAKALHYFDLSCGLGNKEGCHLAGKAMLEMAHTKGESDKALSTHAGTPLLPFLRLPPFPFPLPSQPASARWCRREYVSMSHAHLAVACRWISLPHCCTLLLPSLFLPPCRLPGEGLRHGQCQGLLCHRRRVPGAWTGASALVPACPRAPVCAVFATQPNRPHANPAPTLPFAP